MRVYLISLVCMLSLTLSGCGISLTPAGEAPPLNPQELPTQQLPDSPTQGEETPMNPTLPALQKLIEQAKEDLAQRLSVSISDKSLVEAKEVTWPDASLGCPSPGKVYALGRVPGYRIRLEANGVEYNYHMDQTGQFVLCLDLNLDESNPLVLMTPGPTQRIGPPPIK